VSVLAAGVVLLSACGGSDTRQLVDGGDAERGAVAVEQYGCTSCHAVPGVPSVENGIGPSLDGFAERRYIAGQLPNRPEELIRWLLDPQAIEPGTAMPDTGLSEEEARDIAAYLYDQ
jgi:cytochrome c